MSNELNPDILLVAEACYLTSNGENRVDSKWPEQNSISSIAKMISRKGYYIKDERSRALVSATAELANLFSGKQIVINSDVTGVTAIDNQLTEKSTTSTSCNDKLVSFLLRIYGDIKETSQTIGPLSLISDPHDKRKMSLNLELAVKLAVEYDLVQKLYEQIGEEFQTLQKQVIHTELAQACSKVVKAESIVRRTAEDLQIARRISDAHASLKNLWAKCWRGAQHRSAESDFKTAERDLQLLCIADGDYATVVTAMRQLAADLQLLSVRMPILIELRNQLFDTPPVVFTDCLPGLCGITAKLGFANCAAEDIEYKWQKLCFAHEEQALERIESVITEINNFCGQSL